MSWTCSLCEYDENNGVTCEMCDTARPNHDQPVATIDNEQNSSIQYADNTPTVSNKNESLNKIEDEKQPASMWEFQKRQPVSQPVVQPVSPNNVNTNSIAKGWSCSACLHWNDDSCIQCQRCTLFNPNIMNSSSSNDVNKIESNTLNSQVTTKQLINSKNNVKNCSSCGEQHTLEDKFEWSLCKHFYGKQCAENIAVSHLFYNAVPKCAKCNELLLTKEAEQILQSSELSIYLNIIQSNQSKIMKNNNDNTKKLPQTTTCTDDELKLFLTQNELSMSLYPILVNEDIGYKELSFLTPNDIENLCDGKNIKIGTKINFKNAVKSLTQNKLKSAHVTEEKEEKKKQIYIDRRQSYMFEEPDYKMKIVIIGDSRVGKTSLMCRYVKNVFSEYVISSMGVDSMVNKEKLSDNSIMEIEIWDTAGQERFQSVCRNFYRLADAIIVCFDVTNKLSFTNCGNWRKQIENCAKDNVIVVLVGCKGDKLRNSQMELSDDDSIAEGYAEGNILHNTEKAKHSGNVAEQRALRIIQSSEWKQFGGGGTIYCECSAKTGSNVRNVFITAAELVLQERIKNGENVNYKKKGKTPGNESSSEKKGVSSMDLERRFAEMDDNNNNNNNKKCC
eukprot:237591_1